VILGHITMAIVMVTTVVDSLIKFPVNAWMIAQCVILQCVTVYKADLL